MFSVCLSVKKLIMPVSTRETTTQKLKRSGQSLLFLDVWGD